jgi:hypothetical protein
MKKKGFRAIPDFSRKKKAAPGTPNAVVPDTKVAPPPVPREPIVKPQATSSKSGRRGT